MTLRLHTAFISCSCFLTDSCLGSETASLALLSILLLFDFLLFFVHFFVKVFIVVVSIEKFFEFLLVQQLHVLLDLVTVVIFPFAVCIVRIEVIFIWRNEWRLHSMIKKVFPFEVSQPRMVLHVFWTI